jgi:hypothetical protein
MAKKEKDENIEKLAKAKVSSKNFSSKKTSAKDDDDEFDEDPDSEKSDKKKKPKKQKADSADYDDLEYALEDEVDENALLGMSDIDPMYEQELIDSMSDPEAPEEVKRAAIRLIREKYLGRNF